MVKTNFDDIPSQKSPMKESKRRKYEKFSEETIKIFMRHYKKVFSCSKKIKRKIDIESLSKKE